MQLNLENSTQPSVRPAIEVGAGQDGDTGAKEGKKKIKKRKHDPSGNSLQRRTKGNFSNNPLDKLPKLKKRAAKAKAGAKAEGSAADAQAAEAAAKKAKYQKAPSAAITKTGTFGALGFGPRLVQSLEANLNITSPTRIQRQSAEPLLAGHDTMLKAETGSGKTLAFLMPAVHRLSEKRFQRSDGTKCLILTPVRELANQILAVATELLKGFPWMVASAVTGGERKKSEKARLRKGVTVLVATPGRLLDHLQHTESLKVAHLDVLILDEADRLLDMGFERDLRAIVEILDSKQKVGLEMDDYLGARLRQTVLVSATLTNKGVMRLSGLVLKNPKEVGFEAGDDDGELDAVGRPRNSSTPNTLSHHFLQVESRHRLVALASFLRQKVRQGIKNGHGFKAIVFMSSCDAVDFHLKLFTHAFWPSDGLGRRKIEEADAEDKEKEDGSADEDAEDKEEDPLIDTKIWSLHGRMEQRSRTETFTQFSKATEGIMICTDVAARGLDLPSVDWIVQYDPPDEVADYVHRVGRAGRMGKTGQGVVFLLDSELGYVQCIKQRKICLKPIFLSQVLTSIGAKSRGEVVDPVTVGDGSRAVQACQAQLESLVKTDAELYGLAGAGFQSFVRAYATYSKELKPIFHPKKLHVGHVARSFALREEPKQIKRLLMSKKVKKKDEDDEEGGRDRAQKYKGGKAFNVKKFNKKGQAFDGNKKKMMQRAKYESTNTFSEFAA